MTDRRDHHERPDILVEEYVLRRAALDRVESERRVEEAVTEALSRGIAWDTIGQLLGISAQQAQATYGAMTRQAS